MFALINVRIYDFYDYIENGFIIFNEKITKVGHMGDFTDDGYEVIDGTGHVAMPSLVIGHSHIYSTFARGMNIGPAPVNFREILENLWWRLDSHLTEEDTYMSGIVSAADFARHGVTTVVDHHAGGYIKGSLPLLRKAICEDGGLRGVFCFETSDRFDIAHCIEENTKNADMFGMHASMTLSEESMGLIKEAVGDKPIHIHVAESWLDQENSLSHYGERVVARLERHGLLNRHSILSHCIHIDENEADIIARNQCCVALNIRSNMNNAVGLPDVSMLRDKGIRCIIGNDGMSHGILNEWSTLLVAAKNQYSSPTAFGMDDLLEIVRDGYEYINEITGIKIGRIRPGYDSDLLTVEYEPPSPMDGGNALGHLMFGMADNFTPEHVWCGGRQVVRHYHADDNLMKKYSKAAEVAGRLWERIGSDNE